MLPPIPQGFGTEPQAWKGINVLKGTKIWEATQL